MESRSQRVVSVFCLDNFKDSLYDSLGTMSTCTQASQSGKSQYFRHILWTRTRRRNPSINNRIFTSKSMEHKKPRGLLIRSISLTEHIRLHLLGCSSIRTKQHIKFQRLRNRLCRECLFLRHKPTLRLQLHHSQVSPPVATCQQSPLIPKEAYSANTTGRETSIRQALVLWQWDWAPVHC
jgi:hypothetical protein